VVLHRAARTNPLPRDQRRVSLGCGTREVARRATWAVAIRGSGRTGAAAAGCSAAPYLGSACV